MNTLTQNIQAINQSVQAAQEQANNQEAVKVVAVTKTVEAVTMRQLFDLGIHRFGENRDQVLLAKQEALADISDQIEWHFIGRLQSRKVKSIINQIDYLHSLDRLSLAKEIQKRADQPVKCFLQVNVSGEASKAGFAPEEVVSAIESLAPYDKVQIVGLMTMAPYEASERDLHRYFADLKQLQEKLAQLKLPYAPCQDLSMGMSRDYPIAIAEGATYVRIGTAFFQGLE
ncbi:YggS family pyridoxal phosphate-dependent enzyme [Hutsoniella sourekii]